ncbi:hypothetical protein [Frigidibacter oleivorans]|uniref:hypothetical protein n=1 Tax=Frigidibacter oleivorans TaxID=2487129 RepID=UPI001F173E63|nr:hypothetical protein [Frigidibacter oleivorans]
MAEHVKLRSDGNAPLPVTETGYRSHCVPAGAVAEYGGAVVFVTAWLDHEAARDGWSGAQLSLF